MSAPANPNKRREAAHRALRGLSQRVLILLSLDNLNSVDVADLKNTTDLMAQIANEMWRRFLEDRTPLLPPLRDERSPAWERESRDPS